VLTEEETRQNTMPRAKPLKRWKTVGSVYTDRVMNRHIHGGICCTLPVWAGWNPTRSVALQLGRRDTALL